MLMFMLYVIAAARSTVFVEDSFNRLYSVYDKNVTTVLKVFMKMLHLHGICLSSVRQSLSTSPMEIPGLQGWAGWGGLECGIEKLKTYSTYHSIPDE